MSADEKLLSGKRCLVLDDEFMIALDIQQILEAAGAAYVASASNAADALKCIDEDFTFDLAVLDVKLSASQTSIDVAMRLIERDIPFVFLTGMRRDDDRIRKFPGTPVVEKPYQVALLLEAIGKALARR